MRGCSCRVSGGGNGAGLLAGLIRSQPANPTPTEHRQSYKQPEGRGRECWLAWLGASQHTRTQPSNNKERNTSGGGGRECWRAWLGARQHPRTSTSPTWPTPRPHHQIKERRVRIDKRRCVPPGYGGGTGGGGAKRRGVQQASD